MGCCPKRGKQRDKAEFASVDFYPWDSAAGYRKRLASHFGGSLANGGGLLIEAVGATNPAQTCLPRGNGPALVAHFEALRFGHDLTCPPTTGFQMPLLLTLNHLKERLP
jgi:hypothetical protein